MKHKVSILLSGIVLLCGPLFGDSFNPNIGIIKYDSRTNGKRIEKIKYPSSLIKKLIKNPTPQKEWLLIEREEIDSKAYYKQQQDSINKYRNALDQQLTLDKVVADLQSRLGEKIANEYDVITISSLAESFGTPKEIEKIQKDLKKGKISKSLKDLLTRIEPARKNALKIAEADLSAVTKDWVTFALSKGYPEPEKRFVERVDTITNPLSYDNIARIIRSGDQLNYYDGGYVWMLRTPDFYKGWEWYQREADEVHNEQNSKILSQSYPHAVDYRSYTSHPEYYIINDIAFDKDGKIIRVLDFTGDPDEDFFAVRPRYIYCEQDYDARVKSLLCRESYKQNAYNIKSAGQKVNHYVKNQLGLEELTKAEKASNEKRTDAIANAVVGSAKAEAKYGKNSRRAKQEQNKYAAQFLGALIGGNSYYSDEGANWITQVSNDWQKCFHTGTPYKIERINDTTIRATYCDDDTNPIVDLIFSYTNEKPFVAKETITVDKIYDKPTQRKKSIVDSFDLKDKETEYKVSTDPALTSSQPNNDKIFTAAEQQAEFPGGNTALMKWLGNNIRYPKEAQQKNIQGRVLVKMVIEKDGSIGQASVVKGIDPELDKEALRIVNNMPKWVPAKSKGAPVRSYYTIPITFKLQNQ